MRRPAYLLHSRLANNIIAGLPVTALMLQLVDGILSAVCKTVVLQEDKPDASYRYVCDGKW